jgi:hypothetical protein
MKLPLFKVLHSVWEDSQLSPHNYCAEMEKWYFVIITLCYCCLPATAIQSTHRLALPIFSEVLPVADPEPVVTSSSSSYAATKTVIPQTTIATSSTTGSFLLLTLPSLKSTARATYEITAQWLPPLRKTTRSWKSTRLPFGNRTALLKKITVLPAARFTLPPALPSFTGTASEMGTLFNPIPAADSVLPKMSAYEADATTQPADDYPPVLSVVQTTAAVLTDAGEFYVRDLGVVVASYV